MPSQNSKTEQPVMQSLLDVDLYKLTMLQFIYHRYPQIPVTFAFKNRTASLRLADWIEPEALRDELDHARSLRFASEELDYVAGITVDDIRLFPNRDFLDYLSQFRLPSYDLNAVDGQLYLQFHGPWVDVSLWETIALAIVNELYFRAKLAQGGPNAPQEAHRVGMGRLEDKIQGITNRPNIKFSEFGTRRRFSGDWQAQVVRRLAEAVPDQLLGTSNVALARETGLQPSGTMGHELYMVLAAHAHATEGTPEAIAASHSRVIDAWWDEYGAPLSIVLTDTFGTDFAVRDLTADHAAQWKGQRQDSGSPFDFVDKVIRFYEGHGIDPKTRLAVFSDGLTLETIVEIVCYIDGRMQSAFGWGTNLTNDVGYKPLSLVVKAVDASGKPTVKLSDNLAKANGPGDVIDLYKSIFGYAGTLNERCVY